MARNLIFIALILMSCLTGWLAWNADPEFKQTVFAQLFWLMAGTLIVTFVLETILDADSNRRRRDADRLHFRTITASMLIDLEKIAGLEELREAEILGATLVSQQKFSQEARTIANAIQSSNTMDPDAYERHYLQIDNGLRDLARNFVRLIVTSETDMVNEYRSLNELAERWRYEDKFSVGANDWLRDRKINLEKEKAELTGLQNELREKTSQNQSDDYLVKDVHQAEKRVAEMVSEIEGDEVELMQLRKAVIELMNETATALIEASSFAATSRGLPAP